MNLIDEKEFIKQNNIRVNGKISYLFFSSLLVAPLILLGTYLGFFTVELKMITRIFISGILLNIIYYLLNLNIKYHNITRYVAMILIETFIIIISTYHGIGIYITYGIVPLVSCIYYDYKFSRNICIICYAAMMLSLYIRSYDECWTFQQANPAFDHTRWFISFGLGFTIEYIFVTIMVLLVSKYAKTFFDSLFNQQVENIKVRSQVKVRNDFFARMSHEIRTPINAIIGMNDMILEESNEEAVRKYSYNIQNASKSLLNIVNDILDISKMESNKLKIINEPYDVCQLICEVTSLVELKVKEKNLNLKIELSNNVPSKLYGDEMRIKQIIINLLSNAVKYTHQGFIKLNIACVYMADEELISNEIYKDDIKEYTKLIITVEDSGIGIKKEAINSIFNSFNRIEEEKNRQIQGTGLGMSIVLKLVNLMDGKIDVDSVYGKGSTFYVEIPQGIIDKSPIEKFEDIYAQRNKEKKIRKVEFIAPKAKILVVDDSSMNLIVVKSLSNKLKLQVQTASSGMECLDLIKNNRYDIIFLDHMMPEMDGVETLKLIKSQQENASKVGKVIALTANAIKGAKENYLRLGFDDYLDKPIDLRRFEQIVKRNLPKQLIEAVISADNNNKDDIVTCTLCDNMDNVIKNVGGIEIYNEILNNYYLSIDYKLDELNSYFSEINSADKLKRYTIEVHALKSSARTIGAYELGNLAQEIENYGKNNEVEKIKSRHKDLVEKQLKVKKRIEPYVLSLNKDIKIKKHLSDSELIEKFKALEQATKEMNIDLADKLIAELDKAKLETTVLVLFDELKESILNVDDKKAIKIIHEIINDINDKI